MRRLRSHHEGTDNERRSHYVGSSRGGVKHRGGVAAGEIDYCNHVFL